MTWTKIERGIVVREGVFYVRFQVSGKTVTEATRARTVVQARAERAIRQGRVHDGRHVSSDRKRLTIGDLLDSLLQHWKTAGLGGGPIASLGTRSSQLEIVRKAIGARRAQEWTYRDSANYVGLGATQAQRGTRSNRMSMLRAAFNVALRDGAVDRIPPFPERIDNIRQGYITPEDFEGHVAAFTGVDAQILRFAYRSGQRISRILGLHITEVDAVGWTITGEPAHGNKERPTVPLVGAARQIVQERLDVAVGPRWLLFHRNGQHISRSSIHHKWRALMKHKGLPWTIHDFRRSAARNLVQAGVDPLIAAKITGHRSLSMFSRYAINPQEAVQRAAIQVDSYLSDRLSALYMPGEPTL